MFLDCSLSACYGPESEHYSLDFAMLQVVHVDMDAIYDISQLWSRVGDLKHTFTEHSSGLHHGCKSFFLVALLCSLIRDVEIWRVVVNGDEW